MEYVLHKIKPEYLDQMRVPGGRMVDVRVPDPRDDKKMYNKLTQHDTLFFKDTDGGALKTKVNFVHNYKSAEDLVAKEGVKNLWPGSTTEEATEKCLQFHGYKERVKQQGIYAIGFERLIVYVAGPYTSDSKEGLQKNIKKAEESGVKVAQLGYLSYVPHTAMREWETYMHMDYHKILELCKEWVIKSDALYFLGQSRGANEELSLIESLDRPVFTSLDSLRKWSPKPKKGL